MEIPLKYKRSLVFYDFKRGLNEQQCFDSLQSAFGNEAPPKTAVCDWFAEFRLSEKVRGDKSELRVKTAHNEDVKKLEENGSEIANSSNKKRAKGGSKVAKKSKLSASADDSNEESE